MFFKYLIISPKTDQPWTVITLFLEMVDIAHLIPQWYVSKFKSLTILTRKWGTPYIYCWDWTQSVSSIIKHDKYTKDSLWFLKRFSFNDVNVTLSLLRNSDIWSSSMLRVLEQAFFVGRGVVTWLDGTLGQIEDGPFGRDFPLTFISSKPDGQCNAQTALSLLTLKLALGIALTHFPFSVSTLRKRYTEIFSVFNFSEE